MLGIHLDVSTLLSTIVVASVFSAAARVILWRLHSALPGLGDWAGAGILAAAAFAVLVFCHDQVLTPTIMLWATLPAIGGMALALRGFRRFNGRTSLSRSSIAVLVAAVPVPFFFMALSNSMMGLTGYANFVIALFSGIIAWELFRTAAQQRVVMRLTGCVYGLNAIFFALRTVVVAAADSNALPRSMDDFSPAALLWWLCMNIATTLCMVLMAGERLQVELNDQVRRDPLTGVLNRRAFDQEAERETARSRRNNQALSVLMLDLDRFKTVNDKLGHAGGDAVLQLFAKIAHQELRSQDVFCRFGGEEFVALLPDCAIDQALTAAERLRAAFAFAAAAQFADLDCRDVCFTVSIGISEMRAGESFDALIKRADQALYRAKRDGRNRCEIAESAATILVPAVS